MRLALIFCLLAFGTAVMTTGCGHGVCKKKCGGGGGSGGGGGGQPGPGAGQGNHDTGEDGQGRPFATGPRVEEPLIDPYEDDLNQGDPGLGDPGEDPGLDDPTNPDDPSQDPANPNPTEAPAPEALDDSSDTAGPLELPAPATEPTSEQACRTHPIGVRAHSIARGQVVVENPAAYARTWLNELSSTELREQALRCLTSAYLGLGEGTPADLKVKLRGILEVFLGEGVSADSLLEVRRGGRRVTVPVSGTGILAGDTELGELLSNAPGPFNPYARGPGASPTLLQLAVERGEKDQVDRITRAMEATPRTESLPPEAQGASLAFAIHKMRETQDEEIEDKYFTMAKWMIERLPVNDPAVTRALLIEGSPLEVLRALSAEELTPKLKALKKLLEAKQKPGPSESP